MKILLIGRVEHEELAAWSRTARDFVRVLGHVVVEGEPIEILLLLLRKKHQDVIGLHLLAAFSLGALDGEHALFYRY